MDIKKQIAFCKSIDAETNEKGQYIYESTNKASKISLPYILLEYEQWLRASKNPVPPTSNCTIPVVSSSLPKNVRQLKGMCCAFFRYWWNAEGNNTEQGFDEWYSKWDNLQKAFSGGDV
jgi:hypothetical protein